MKLFITFMIPLEYRNTFTLKNKHSSSELRVILTQQIPLGWQKLGTSYQVEIKTVEGHRLKNLDALISTTKRGAAQACKLEI